MPRSPGRLVTVSIVSISILVLVAACGGGHKKTPAPTTTTSSTPPTTTSSTAPTTTSSAAPTTTTSAPTTTTVEAGPAVQILSLTGPPSPVECNALTSVELRWEARGASKVELHIDGGPVFATYPSGKQARLAPLACDGNSHTYTLTARAANGATASKSLTLAERALIS